MAGCGSGAVSTQAIQSVGGSQLSSSAPLTLAGLSCDQSSVTGAMNSTCTATLSGVAGSGGVVVALNSDSPAATVPATTTVAPGASAAIFTAKLTPVAASTTANISAAYGSTRTFSVQLNAASPQIGVSATAIDFGGVTVGSSAVSQTLKLSSTGTAPLTVNSLALSGSSFSASSTQLPLILAPGASTTVTLKMTPPANSGPTSGSITINSNATSTPTATVQLTATATTPQAAINGLFCSSTTIIGMGANSCTVVLSSAASTNGLVAAISSNNAAVTVPATVTIASGQTKASFTATRVAAGTTPIASLTAAQGTATRTTALTMVASSPVFSMVGGSYSNNVTLSMTDATPGVAMYYTTDGSTPTTSSIPYVGPISITTTETVQAIAAGAGSAASQPTVASYKIATSTTTTTAAPIPAGSSFVTPAADACQSPYDQFYGAEPGVYAFWPMCEAGTNIDIFDYVGNWGLSSNYTSGQVLAWGSGSIAGGLPGPVPDNETAAQVAATSSYRTNVGIPLNMQQGTVAVWIQAQATPSLEQAMFFYTAAGQSSLGLGTKTDSTSSCFVVSFKNAAGTSSAAQQCGYNATSWYRVVATWGSGTLSLYVNGSLVTATPYTGTFDNTVFNYRLFPGCCGYSKSMTLAKALVANQAWTVDQVSKDFSPSLVTPPTGGLFITSNQLGAIHKDILGVADDNANLATSAQIGLLKSGFAAAGITSVRYANGFGGLTADLENWRGGRSCTTTLGGTQAAQNTATQDTITNYIPTIAQPLNLSIGFTVNYGTDASNCDGPGDPDANGGDLVNFTNVTNGYGIKYWEIGNEVWSANTEADFHSNPHTGASYSTYEPQFYDSMKAKDPSIQIGLSISGSNYNTQTGFDLPSMAAGKYDAIVYHNYPIKTSPTDGTTLYRDRAATNLMKTRGELLTLQTELLSNGKSPDAIWVTEWDANPSGNKWTKQSMGAVMPLFAAGELAEYMRAGVRYATWWAQSAIDVCSNSNYDSSGDTAYNWWTCGAAGLVYNGPNAAYGYEVSVGLKPGDLLPPARAFQLLSQSGFVVEGEHMLATVADAPGTPWLQGYGATHGNSYAVLLINRDRDSAHTVPLQFDGMSLGTSVTQWTYGRAQYDLTQTGDWSASPVQTNFGAWAGSFSATLPPWSVNVLIFNR